MPRIAAAIGIFALIVFSIGFNMVRYPRVWEMVGVSPHLAQSSESAQPAAASEPAPGDSDDTNSDHPGTDEDSTYDRADDQPRTPADDTDAIENDNRQKRGGSADKRDKGKRGKDKQDTNKQGTNKHGMDPYGSDKSGTGDDEPYEYASNDYHSGDYDSDNSHDYGNEDYGSEDYGSEDYGSESYGAERPYETESSSPYADDADGADVPVRSSSGKPMVPLARPEGAYGFGGTAESDSGIRRLPPVDRTDGAMATLRSSDGPPPFYPTTGVD